jgi:predicted XRE-type DNA-binding protein
MPTKTEPKTSSKKSEPRERSLKIDPQSFNSVQDMLRATLDPEDADRIVSRIDARELVRSLVVLRMTQGLTQGELAARMDCGQTKVSKIERSQDADLGLGDIVAFARALGKGVRLVIGQGDGLTIEVEGRPEATGRKRVR